jgi:hypothetical protein
MTDCGDRLAIFKKGGCRLNARRPIDDAARQNSEGLARHRRELSRATRVLN